MKRIHADSFVPKYQSGKWSWNKNTESLHFQEHFDLEHANERYIDTNGFKFLRTIDQEEEVIFRQLYVRSDNTYDVDTVVLNDIRDLVLFLMPKEFLSMKFLEFMHQPAVHRMLNALIIYFEYFLRLVEFILIRRDELSGNMAQVQSEQTNETKRIFSTYLGQYRMILARNYSIIIMGEGDMAKYYHTKPVVNISSTIKDRILHEHFVAVATQIVWISMHRRAYFIIEMEMNRLFRSEHFLMNRREYPKFTPVERHLLYGRNSKILNYRAQCSPMIQELELVSDEDMPILWIGERMYRGSDRRIAEIELEFLAPGSQLCLIHVIHGILGHPKQFYDTLLRLHWPSVRNGHFSLKNDPFNMLRQPNLKIPKINEMDLRRLSKNFEQYFKIYCIYEPCKHKVLRQWFKRDKIITFYRKGGILVDLEMRCEISLQSGEELKDPEQTVQEYSDYVAKFRKNIAFARVGNAPTAGAKKIGCDYYFD